MSESPSILLTGADGQLGRALQQTAQACRLVPLSRREFDLTMADQIREAPSAANGWGYGLPAAGYGSAYPAHPLGPGPSLRP